MKRCAFLLAFLVVPIAVGVTRAEAPKPAPPEVYVPPEAERLVLSNGIVVYLVENHELPLFDLRIRFRSTPADATPRYSFGLFGTVWRTGGTTHLSPDALDDKLESMAANISTDAGDDSFSIGVSCLSRDMPEALDLWQDVMLNPAFNETKLTIAKGQALEELRRKNETPNQIGRRAFRDVLYGPDHPYSENPLAPDLEKISRRDLLAIHKRVIVPEGAIISVAGDFDKKALIADLERRFATWPKTGRMVPSYDYTPKPEAGSVFLVEKDAAQSRVTIGRLGPSRLTPDRSTLQVADYILGSSGPSRLFSEIRSRLGLAYMVGSFVVRPTGPGMVGVVSLTRTDATVAATGAILNELKKFSEAPVRPEELDLAKAAIVNAQVFNFDRPMEVADQDAEREFFHFPADEFVAHQRRVLGATADDVLAVARKYYNPADMKILVVGNPKKFDGKLDKFGKVTTIPLESIR